MMPLGAQPYWIGGELAPYPKMRATSTSVPPKRDNHKILELQKPNTCQISQAVSEPGAGFTKREKIWLAKKRMKDALQHHIKSSAAN
jgi:hypothetical protein